MDIKTNKRKNYIEKSMKRKLVLAKINKIWQTWSKTDEKEGQKTQITKIRNETRVITTDPVDIERLVRWVTLRTWIWQLTWNEPIAWKPQTTIIYQREIGNLNTFMSIKNIQFII